MSLRANPLWLALLVGASLPNADSLPSQEWAAAEAPTAAANHTIEVTVRVRDRHGRPAQHLEAGDFEVVADSARRPIEAVREAVIESASSEEGGVSETILFFDLMHLDAVAIERLEALAAQLVASLGQSDEGFVRRLRVVALGETLRAGYGFDEAASAAVPLGEVIERLRTTLRSASPSSLEASQSRGRPPQQLTASNQVPSRKRALASLIYVLELLNADRRQDAEAQRASRASLLYFSGHFPRRESSEILAMVAAREKRRRSVAVSEPVSDLVRQTRAIWSRPLDQPYKGVSSLRNRIGLPQLPPELASLTTTLWARAQESRVSLFPVIADSLVAPKKLNLLGAGAVASLTGGRVLTLPDLRKPEALASYLESGYTIVYSDAVTTEPRAMEVRTHRRDLVVDHPTFWPPVDLEALSELP